MAEKSFIAFLDILGTRDLAKNSPEEYYDTVFKFQRTIIELGERQPKSEKSKVYCYFFSDCCYLESFELPKLLEYVSKMRIELFTRGIYIRGGVSKGTLGIKPGSSANHLDRNLQKRLDKLRPHVEGRIFFDKSVSHVFGLEQSLKGIGIHVDPGLAYEEELVDGAGIPVRPEVVRNFYLPEVNAILPVPYLDLRLPMNLFTPVLIDKVLSDYMTANIKSKKYGRMFVAFMATMLNSEEEMLVSFRDLSLESVPCILDALIDLPRKYEFLYSTASGIQYLYLKALDRVYAGNNSEEAKLRLSERICSMRGIMHFFRNGFDSLPNEVMSGSSKIQFLKYFKEIQAARASRTSRTANPA